MSEQIDIIKKLADAAHAANALIISEIGSQSVWLHASGDHPSHLYLSGPMSISPSVALGVAVSHPDRPVLCICGDGALAMNLGALATISTLRPSNLFIAVMDNKVYDFTGSLPSPSAGIDWQQMGSGLTGFTKSMVFTEDSDIDFSNPGPQLIVCPALPTKLPPAALPFSPPEIHKRFLAQC